MSYDGRRLAYVSDKADEIIIWDWEKKTQIGIPLKPPEGFGPSELRFSPNGLMLAARMHRQKYGKYESLIGVFNVQNGQIVKLPFGRKFSLSDDGKRIAIWPEYDFKRLDVWRIGENGAAEGPKSLLFDEVNLVHAMAFNHKGDMLAFSSGHRPYLVRLDGADLKKEKFQGMFHINPIKGLAFNKNDKTLISYDVVEWDRSFDRGQIILWDVTTRRPLIKAQRYDTKDDICCMGFSKDGDKLMVGDKEGNIMVWDVDPASWQRKACNIAGGSMDEDWWNRLFPNETYQPTCRIPH
jgi:WD40 repeat protein